MEFRFSFPQGPVPRSCPARALKRRLNSERVSFRDGSLDDETTVFSQRQFFKLISDHHVQRGPSFPKPIDVSIDATSGQITSQGEDGKINQEHLELPADVSNGLPLIFF
jgi:hypothetical protein